MAIVETSCGPLEGLERGGHLAFLGVPFTAPPVGARRFRAPEPPAAWAPVTRAATAFAASAPQAENSMQGFVAGSVKDEDCLYLNVYTPAADDARRPVLFWVHGGGFTNGSGSIPLFDGGRLAERGDVVVVTAHYRLGALGFLWLDGYLEGETANAGLLDLVAALGWVRDEIERFGGDPRNVTLFGESAGATAIASLLAMPPARGLFHRAVMQSGGGRSTAPEHAREKAAMMLEELGLDPAEAARLREVAVAEILEAQARVEQRVGNDQPRRIGPVRDGVTLPEPPPAAIATGHAAGIPLLIGTNRDEWKLWTGMERHRAPIADADLAAAVQRAVPGAGLEAARALIETYRRGHRAASLPHASTDILDAITGGVRFHVPSLRIALAQSGHAPVYRYLFTWESPARRGAMGACHALDLPFVFGTLDAPMQARFAGRGREAERLSGQVMDAWVAFARTGNPSHEGIGDWPAFDAARRATMILGRACGAEDDPFGEELAALDGVLG